MTRHRGQRLRDRFPARQVDPLVTVHDYVDRRVSSFDASRERRQRRNRARDPRRSTVTPVMSIEPLNSTPAATTLEYGQLYRVIGGAGVADTFIARAKNAAGVDVVRTFTIT